MYKPKISIITAVYNRADKIEQCISSVVSQTYDNIEYIVIDGGSADGTVDVIKKYADGIAYWCSEPDEGIYDAWNKALRHSTGDYVHFIGSDDCLYDKETIQMVVNELDDDVDVLSGCFYTVMEQEGMEMYSTNELMLDKDRFPGHGIPMQGLFIKRALFGADPFDTSYRIAADFKFMAGQYYDSNIRFKYISNPIQYFENGGISSMQVAECNAEYQRIYKDLGLNQFIGNKREDNCIKTTLKELLKTLGVLYPVRLFYHAHIKKDWHRHHCSNKICRWCGRGVQ